MEHYKEIYVKLLKAYIKMEKTIIKFDDIEILRQKFHQHKRPILVKKNVDINKIVAPNKVPFGKKKDLNFLLLQRC